MAGCRFLNQGNCDRQNRKCPYTHDSANMLRCEMLEIQSIAADGKCKYLLKSGLCRIGQNTCNFRDDPEGQRYCRNHHDDEQDSTADEIKSSRQKLSGLHITG